MSKNSLSAGTAEWPSHPGSCWCNQVLNLSRLPVPLVHPISLRGIVLMDSMIQLIDVPNCDAQMFEGSDVSNQPRGLTDISCSTTLNRGNRIFLSIRWHKQDSMFSQSARAFNIFNPKPAVVRTSPRAISPYEREPFKSLDSRMSHRWMQNGRMFLTWKPTSLDATLKT